MTCNGFELESPNLHQICILGICQMLLKMGIIDIYLQGHLAISTLETAFNITLVYWSRPAKGCYTSQMCSCTKNFPESLWEQISFKWLSHKSVTFRHGIVIVMLKYSGCTNGSINDSENQIEHQTAKAWFPSLSENRKIGLLYIHTPFMQMIFS